MIHLLRSIFYGVRSSISNIVISLVSSFGILFIITFLILYMSFRSSVQTFIDENFLGNLDINEIVIEPENETRENVYASGSGRGAKLTRDQVLAVREMEDFKETFTLIQFDYRVRLRIEMFGTRTAPLLPFYAIEPEFFEGKVDDWTRFYYRPGGSVPVIAPKFTIMMINNYLYFQGMPQFKITDMKNFPLTIKVESRNKITMPGGDNSEANDGDVQILELDSHIYDFTAAIDRPGAIVPMDFITYFSRRAHYADGRWKRGYTYLMMYAKVKDIKKLPETVKKLEELGLRVKSQSDIAKKANQVLEIIDQFSFAIIGILLVLTVISIFNANLNIVNQMSHKFSLTRILGVTKIRIVLTFILESAVVGALYGIIGYYAGNYLFEYAAEYIQELLPEIASISFEASRDTQVLYLAIILSAGVSAASSFIPAIFASNINLFKAVRR
jgi:ABC-type lipoprotein release transport system permease subunit